MHDGAVSLDASSSGLIRLAHINDYQGRSSRVRRRRLPDADEFIGLQGNLLEVDVIWVHAQRGQL
jgi:hypothetical protein